MPQRVLLHVGTHKTGSTSLQHFFRDQNDTLLAAVGASYPDGFLIPTMHSELPLLTIRPERLWPARIRFPETQGETWLAAAAQHVRTTVHSSPPDILVWSHEDLSYLRFDDQVQRLRDLLDPREVTVVAVLRDKNDFLRSYGDQLEAMGFSPSDDPSSFAYVGPDSWLVDYDALLDGYRRCFGHDNVKALDYDEAVRTDGSVIPAFADLLGVARSSLPALDGYFWNRAGVQLRPSDGQLAEIRQRLAQNSP